MTTTTKHRVRVTAQTWRNVPPYAEKTLYRASCACGWHGPWFSYAENVEKRCNRP